MFGDLMKLTACLGAFAGLIAFGWVSVYRLLGDSVAANAGVPPKVWQAFQRYDPDVELAEAVQVVEFVQKMRDAQFPRSLLLAQFLEFCESDASPDSGRDYEACSECFQFTVATIYSQTPSGPSGLETDGAGTRAMASGGAQPSAMAGDSPAFLSGMGGRAPKTTDR